LKGVRPSKRKPPKAPFKGAPAWKCSVYYYWWEYLRRHEGYRQCCASGGAGGYASLYADFGGVHAHDDFWQWWSKERHNELFCEPTARPLRAISKEEAGSAVAATNTLLIEVPLEVRSVYLVRAFRRILRQNEMAAKKAQQKSRARYPVAAKPVLSSLHQHLVVWDARQQHSELKLHELYDLVEKAAGLFVNDSVNGETIAQLKKLDLPYRDIQRVIKGRQANLVSRHLRIADQYIDNVGKGLFPLRATR
jgi:hypothetical protein